MVPDGHGLHLYVPTSGSKLWRLRYRFAGKANMLSLGAFPETSLAEARKKRDAIRAQIAAGTDPSLKRKTEKIETLAAKKSFLQEAVDRRALVFFCHDPVVAVGRITDENGRHQFAPP